jgi:phospholipid transport system substrate-binding protein
MRAGGSFVPVDYRLHQRAEAWKVFDVIVDGVSYVRTHHDDVDSDVSQKGLEFAIARLEKLGAVAGAHAASVSPDPIRAR